MIKLALILVLWLPFSIGCIAAIIVSLFAIIMEENAYGKDVLRAMDKVLAAVCGLNQGAYGENGQDKTDIGGGVTPSSYNNALGGQWDVTINAAGTAGTASGAGTASSDGKGGFFIVEYIP